MCFILQHMKILSKYNSSVTRDIWRIYKLWNTIWICKFYIKRTWNRNEVHLYKRRNSKLSYTTR